MKNISLLLMLVLAGCSALGPDYQRPESNLPQTFSGADAAQTDSTEEVVHEWWTYYQDEKLNELVELALQNNTNIQLAAARIEEADAKMREVGAYLFPEVTLSAEAKRSRVTEKGAFPTFTSPIRNNYTFGLNTTYEIDFWGELKRSKEAARASALASRDAKETIVLSLVGLVTSNYLQLRGLEAQIAVTKDNQKSRIESLDLTKRRLAGGVASSLEVSQAEVAVSNLDAQMIELNRLRALSLHQLAILTGELELNLDVGDIRSLPMPPVPPAGLPSDLLENRPDVRQAEQNLVAQNAQIGIAKAALYPSISLTAEYGGESLLLKNLLKSGARIWTLGLGLDLPIFDSGKRNARVDQVTAKQKQALAEYQTAIQNAFREVNDALVNRRLNAEREQALTRSTTSAKNALSVAENRYKAGYSAYLDVLDAQRVYNDASIASIQAKQATFLSTVELFKALGGDWSSGWKNEQAPAATQP
jgi:outer membrane protein, multidrug efflux system